MRGIFIMGFCRRRYCTRSGLWGGLWRRRGSVVGVAGGCISVLLGGGIGCALPVRAPGLGEGIELRRVEPGNWSCNSHIIVVLWMICYLSELSTYFEDLNSSSVFDRLWVRTRVSCFCLGFNLISRRIEAFSPEYGDERSETTHLSF